MILKDAEVEAIRAAAERLEKRFEFLKDCQCFLDEFKPCYSGIIEPKPVGPHDDKCSLLGGFDMFCSPSGSWEAIPFPDYVGLAQLDLDEVCRETGRNVGSGLLQVWMKADWWGSGSDLGESIYVSIVPRDVVDVTEGRTSFSYKTDYEEEYLEEQSELDALWKDDPDAAYQKLYEHHYFSGCYGYDWLRSSYYGAGRPWDSVPHGIGHTGSPLVIVGWEHYGYETGYYVEAERSIWSSSDLADASNLSGFKDDPDFKLISEILAKIHDSLRVGLFSSSYDDPLYVQDHPESGWKPLFCFDGPVSGAVVDTHTIFYRSSNGEFEYAGTCRRFKC